MDKTLRLAYDADARSDTAKTSPISTLPDIVQHMFNKDGIFGLGEAYIAGLWDKPELNSFMFQVFCGEDKGTQRKPWLGMLHLLARNYLLNPHAKRFAFNIARHHYDLGNDLFAAMLDGTMTYTCGYWSRAKNLEEAQTAKLDLICQKLELNSGSQVLDIGCGWGNFAKHAASRYGAKVTGITVSKEQAQFARENCRGLPVEILISDYRVMQGRFDQVVSIEMIEAVGKRNIPKFFSSIDRNLKPGGKALVQSISAETFSASSDPAMDQFTLWIMKHIFPDGYLPNLRELTDPAKKRFYLEDLESFGEHYDPTLMAWAANFERNWPGLAPKYGEFFRRTWKFYLESCAALFRARKAHVYQLLYSKKA